MFAENPSLMCAYGAWNMQTTFFRYETKVIKVEQLKNWYDGVRSSTFLTAFRFKAFVIYVHLKWLFNET